MVRKAQACRAAGKGYVGQDVVESYTLRHITAQGDLQVGCHFIPWQSISEAMARFQGEVME